LNPSATTPGTASAPKTRGTALNRAGWLLAALPVLANVWLIFRYGLNVPKWDDHALRNFLVNFNQADGVAERLTLLLAQHNEHRIAYDRLVALVLYQLSGEINFDWLMAAGFLSLLGILFVFWKVIRESRLPDAVFWPLPFLLLSFQHHENTLWGMAALQNFSVVFFVLCAVFAVVKGTERAFGWALFFSTSALITSGNGLLAWPVVACLLLMQRRWQGLGIWLLATAVAVGLYFFQYEKPPGNPATSAVSVGRYVQGFLALIGGVADWRPASPNRFVGPVLVGSVLLLLAVFLNWRALRRSSLFSGKAKPADYFLMGVTVFALVTALVVVVGRIGFGEAVLLTSRIKIYSAVFACTLLVAVARELPPTWTSRLGRSALGFSVLFWIGTAFVEWEEIVFARHERITWLYNWRQGQGAEALPNYDRERFPYRAPALSFFSGNAQPTAARLPVQVEERPDGSWLVATDSLGLPVGPEAGAYLFLAGPESTRLLPTRQHPNRSRRSLLTGGGCFAPGFTAVVQPTDAPPGRYTILVKTTDGSRARTYATGQILTLKPTQPSNLPKNW